jgi:outer membrane protein
MKLKKGILFLLLLFVTVVVKANNTIVNTTEDSIGKELNLNECIRLALKNNHLLKQSEYDKMIAKNKTKELKADVLPQINAYTGFTDNISSPVVILPGELLDQPNTSIPVELVSPCEIETSIELSQIISNPALFSGIKTAKNAEELVALKKDLREDELIYEIGVVFYDILYSEQRLSNVISNLNMQDSLYRYMSHRAEQDLIRDIDLSRINVGIINLKVQEEQLNAIIDQQKRYLKILTGIPLNAILQLDNSILNDIYLPVDILSYQYDVLDRKELAILNKQRELELSNIKCINSQYLPNLSLAASGGYLFQSDKFRLTNSESWFDYSYVGIRLNVPIFDGFRKQKQVHQIKNSIYKLEEKIKYTMRFVDMQHENAKRSVLVAYQAIGAQKENLRLSEKIYEQSQLLFKEGLHSVTDLLQTEVSLKEAQTAYWSEVIKYKKSVLDLMKAEGVLCNLLNDK